MVLIGVLFPFLMEAILTRTVFEHALCGVTNLDKGIFQCSLPHHVLAWMLEAQLSGSIKQGRDVISQHL